MAKTSGLGDQFLIGGTDIGGDINSISSIHGGPMPWSVTDITESAYERVGLARDGSIEWVSYFNPARAHPVLSVEASTDTQASYFRGSGIGNWAASCVAQQVSYDANRSKKGELTLKVRCLSNGYGVEWGQALTSFVRTDTTATNGTALDYGSTSTAFGGQAYLHATAFTGTSVTVKLQDSADNSTFADLSGAGFTAVTAAGFQRIAFTGTVRRYVRAVSSGTFSSASFAVNFVRNLTAVSF